MINLGCYIFSIPNSIYLISLKWYNQRFRALLHHQELTFYYSLKVYNVLFYPVLYNIILFIVKYSIGNFPLAI